MLNRIMLCVRLFRGEVTSRGKHSPGVRVWFSLVAEQYFIMFRETRSHMGGANYITLVFDKPMFLPGIRQTVHLERKKNAQLKPGLPVQKL